MASRSYLSGVGSTRRTAQRERIPGRGEQVKNAAGGYVFKLDPLAAVRRWLVIGSAGGTYYVGRDELTKQNVELLRKALDEKGVEVVDAVVEISEAGRAIKNDQCIFALAMAIAHKDDAVKQAAKLAVPRVCRTGTHLFMFVAFAEQFRGWGSALKKAVAAWYGAPPITAMDIARDEMRDRGTVLRRDPSRTAYQAAKYGQRDGWSHRDLLKLSHPNPPSPEYDAVYRWICGTDARTSTFNEGYGNAGTRFSAPVSPLWIAEIRAAEEAKRAEKPADTVALLKRYGSKLPREAIRSEHSKEREVNEALLAAGMPQTALIRNLANLTRYGVLQPMGMWSASVANQLTNPELLRKARVHPFSVLVAMAQYRSGRGRRGVTWGPVREIVDALDRAFYLSFPNVKPSGKRTMLAIDVSASMSWSDSMIGRSRENPQGLGLTAREAAAAMALVQANVGDPYMTVTWSMNGDFHRDPWPISRGPYVGHHVQRGIAEFDLSPRQRLDDCYRELERLAAYAGGTDAALPMLYATERNIEVDTFVLLTDNETWGGDVHPTQALELYRQKSGIDAKMVVVAMTATGYSLADPTDPKRQLDVAGFDTATPNVIADFVRGDL